MSVWAEGLWSPGVWAEGLWSEGGGSDTTPDQFAFANRTGVALNTTITSTPVTITGINAPSPISVSGGMYIINGGEPTNSPGTVVNGDQVQAQHTSSASNLTAVSTTVTVGGVSSSFTSITRGAPAPGSFGGQGRVRLGGIIVIG